MVETRMCRNGKSTGKMGVKEEEEEQAENWQLKRYPQPDANSAKHTFRIGTTIIQFDLCNIRLPRVYSVSLRTNSNRDTRVHCRRRVGGEEEEQTRRNQGAIDSVTAVGVSQTCSVTSHSVSVTHRAPTNTMSALSSPSSRRHRTGAFDPSTPRNSKISYNISTPPSATPSISSSTPFDWDAARLRKPPPYGTPFVDRRLQALRNGGGQTPSKSTPTKRIVRKKTMWEK